MRRSFLTLFSLLLPTVAMAQDAHLADRRVEIDAAFAVARADLRTQLLAVPVSPNIFVKSLIHAGPGIDVDGLLASAQQVGQPRWVGEDIVQVAIRLPADALVERVRAAGLAAGIKKFEFEKFARLWAGRSLQGSGQAIPAARVAAVVTTLRPAAWSVVPDAARVDAVNRARQNATGTIVDQAVAIPLGQGQTAGDNFASPDARDRIAAWADTLPATRVVLSDQREVQLSVHLDKRGLGEVMRAQMSSGITSQSDKTQMMDTRISAMPDTIVGRASIQLPPPPQLRPVLIFRQALAWAGDTLTAEGTAAANGSALRTARRAEATARAALRQKILKLPMTDTTTIEQAIGKDSTASDAISSAVDRARVYQADYNPDGSATVRLSLDGNELLNALATPR